MEHKERQRGKKFLKSGSGSREWQNLGRGWTEQGDSWGPRQCPLSGPQVQASKQELHYASLLRLPEQEGPDIRKREGNKEDPSGDYACIAENKPT